MCAVKRAYHLCYDQQAVESEVVTTSVFSETATSATPWISTSLKPGLFFSYMVVNPSLVSTSDWQNQIRF